MALIDRARRQRMTVGGHLARVIAVATAISLLVGFLIARQAMDEERDRVRDGADHLASTAAEAVKRDLTVAEQQVAAAAASPALLPFIADGDGCQLSFDLTLFEGAHLDIVRTDGRTTCSSLGAAATSMYAGAPWLPAMSSTGGTTAGRPLLEHGSGAPSFLVWAPVREPSGTTVGAVVVRAPTRAVAGALTESYGGARRYELALVHAGTGEVLSALDATEGGRPFPSDFLEGSSPVQGTDWRVVAALPASRALAGVSAVLTRVAVLAGAFLIVMLAAMAAVHRRVARPLRRLADAVRDSGPQMQERLAHVGGTRETVRLAQAFNDVMQVREDYERDLTHQALHDPLTGLPNRALLADRLEHSLEQSLRSGLGLSVLFLDLDRFKLINDGLGHGSGDELLVAISRRLEQAMRPGDTLARFGGDEFVIVAEGVDDASLTAQLADRVLAAVKEPVQIGDVLMQVTASIGITVCNLLSTPEQLLSEADAAMYEAKAAGGGVSARFNESHRGRATTRMHMEKELRSAIERRQLHVVYQPKVELATGRTIGVESLLRWDHPTLGPVSPMTFIPVAEETGLIGPIGEFVLRETCVQAAAWQAEGFAGTTVSVNVSGRQLADTRLFDQVASVLSSTGLDPGLLCLELTESVLMNDTAHTARTLQRLHQLGVKISIDDFGTGYSSLAYVQRFPADELKIDRTFISGIDKPTGQRTLVKAMIAMAQALDMHVVAEGVETIGEAATLRQLGCDAAQGFLYARPEPAKAVQKLLVARQPHRIG